jgi:hypothetical protein
MDQFHCREVYVYAMGQEPLLNYVTSLKCAEDSRPIVQSNRLIQGCLAQGIYAEGLFRGTGDSPVLRCMSVSKFRRKTGYKT